MTNQKSGVPGHLWPEIKKWIDERRGQGFSVNELSAHIGVPVATIIGDGWLDDIVEYYAGDYEMVLMPAVREIV